MNFYLNLFLIFLKVGAFTLGGGYAMIPVIQREVVHNHKLIDADEFLDIIAVSQSLPGAIAVNSAVFIGYKLAGIIGSLVTLLGIVLPSLVVIITVAIFYNEIKGLKVVQAFFQGVRPAIVALIAATVVKLTYSIPKKYINFFIITLSFVGIALLDIHPIVIIIACALIGLIFSRKEDSDELP
ncbi:MAG: chromate transporter [Clostridiales bacterium]|nr:chromate transporter [Clostridiales bacterium]